MAKGFAAFVMEEHRIVEKELLEDAYKRAEEHYCFRYLSDECEDSPTQPIDNLRIP